MAKTFINIIINLYYKNIFMMYIKNPCSLNKNKIIIKTFKVVINVDVFYTLYKLNFFSISIILACTKEALM